jgi:hypothetical protein
MIKGIEMKLVKRMFFLMFFFNAFFSINCSNVKDDMIVDKINKIFLREYDNYKDKSAIVRILLRMGRKAYLENLILWKDNYQDITKIKFSLHPVMEQMAKIMDKNAEPEKAVRFRSLLEDLTKMAFKNMDIYFLAIKEYINENNLTCDDIDLDIFADALAKKKFYDEKIKLYSEEYKIEDELGPMMKEKKVKYKMLFYSYAFEYFVNIRKQIISQETKDMEYKLWLKSQK